MESIKKGCKEIPEDVIIEILSRLPVKSVIRARAVCKNWYIFTKNPSFVTKHFNHHTNNSGCLFVTRFDKISKRFVFSLFPDETLAGSPPVYRDVVVDMLHRVGVVASPCNGLLCLSNDFNRLALWNPATREFRSLPVLPLNFPPNVVINQETFGFGLDPITNDYKVVWIWETVEDFDEAQSSYGPYQVAVYSLSTDSWRYLDHVALPYSIIDTPLSNACINGVYHWLAIHDDGHPVILSFDMGNELFHEIRDIPSSKRAFLAPYKNTLALIYYDSRPVVDIWVMMEEGGWTKVSTVQLLSEYRFPLGFWKNNQLFIMKIDGVGRVALYDPETREIRDLESPIWDHYLIYRESLVTIRAGDGFPEQDQLSDIDQVLNFSFQA